MVILEDFNSDSDDGGVYVLDEHMHIHVIIAARDANIPTYSLEGLV